jgi:hypothetical protein
VRSRVTIRRKGAGLQRSSEEGGGADDGVAAALRKSREALVDIQGQLDALLAALRNPDAAPDAGAPERLRSATRRAGSALAALGTAAATR